MPLRDHFRSPVNDTHSWDEAHGQWPGEMVRSLNTILPSGFRAGPRVHLGSPFEVDERKHDLDSCDPDAIVDRDRTSDPTVLHPTLIIEADLSVQDEYEVRVYESDRWPQPVAAIEIVSPSNGCSWPPYIRFYTAVANVNGLFVNTLTRWPCFNRSMVRRWNHATNLSQSPFSSMHRKCRTASAFA